MGISFANPAALGLFGLLAIPLLVHLLAQGDYRVISVGSLRWLRSKPPSRWSRLQLRDPWRLALRCLLTIAAVLALAQPYWSVPPEPPRTQLLVDPLADRAVVTAALDELAAARGAQAVDVRWLSMGFAPWQPSAPAPVSAEVPLYALLATADIELPPGPLVVIASPEAHRLGWRRPSLGREIEWITLPGDADQPAASPSPRSVLVVHEGRPDVAARVAAAVRAWEASGRRQLGGVAISPLAELPSTVEADWVVWLGRENTLPPVLSALAQAGTRVLSDSTGDVLRAVTVALDGEDARAVELVREPLSGEVPAWRAITGEVVLVRGPGTDQLRLLGALRPGSDGLLDSGAFPGLLLDWLSDGWRAPLPRGLVVTVDQALPRTGGEVLRSERPMHLAGYLLTIALLLWALDRLLSLRPGPAARAAR